MMAPDCQYCYTPLGPGEVESHAACRSEFVRRESECRCEKCGGVRMSKHGKWCRECYLSASPLYRNFPGGGA